MRFVQEFRSSRGGNLSNMTIQEMVGGVTQLILDHQVLFFFFFVKTPIIEGVFGGYLLH